MFQDNHITDTKKSQEVEELLIANTLTAFKKHRLYRQKYQEFIYPTLNKNQRALWDLCSSDIWVRPDNTVASLNSCRNRFCAICNWRAARKRYSYTIRAMQQLENEGKYAYLFLTMTLRNCEDWELPETISNIMQSVNRMQSTKTWKKRVKGFIRQMEVTYNDEADTYHPHLHYIVAVPSTYFTDSELYMYTWQWRELWERSMRLDYVCQFDLESIRGWEDGTISAQVCEVSKYQIKLSSVVEKKKGYPIRIIAEAIKGRRMVAYGGIYAEINRALKQADKDNADDMIEGLRYVFEADLNDYVCIGQATIKRTKNDKKERPLLLSQMAREEARIQEKLKRMELSAKSETVNIKKLRTLEEQIISEIDAEPQETGIKYDDYRIKRAELRRQYDKLYKRAIKEGVIT